MASVTMHLGLLISTLVLNAGFEDTTSEWLMFLEGLLDCQVQFYMYYMAPIQIARLHRVT